MLNISFAQMWLKTQGCNLSAQQCDLHIFIYIFNTSIEMLNYLISYYLYVTEHYF